MLTLLSGQVFYASDADKFVYIILTVLVLTMLTANAVVIGVVLYMEFKPEEDDAHKDFASMVFNPADTVSKLLFIFMLQSAVFETVASGSNDSSAADYDMEIIVACRGASSHDMDGAPTQASSVDNIF